MKILEKLKIFKKKEPKIKPKVGIFSFTSCSGCQLEILNLEDVIVELSGLIDIQHFPMLQQKNSTGPFEIAFIEGGITNEEQLPKIKSIREKSKYVVSLGSCAGFGGVNAMRSFLPFDAARKVYSIDVSQKPIDPTPIDAHIKVDYYIRGCPIIKEEFVFVVKQLLRGIKPMVNERPVCSECKKKENTCVLIEGKNCFGPITYAGCDALCPSIGVECTGCRGPVSDCQAESLIHILEKKGYDKKDLQRELQRFAGKSQRLKFTNEKTNEKNKVVKK